ncbi:MAG: aminopeptidase P family protein [Firmicutes bacterium]|nr:aminopeptidase P family protein [Bacillota bacterium]
MERARRALENAREHGADALIVQSAPNRRYLTGFTGSEGTIVITSEGVHLLVDFRYVEQAKLQAPGAHVQMYRREELWAKVAEALAAAGARRPGFEAEHVSWARWRKMVESLPEGVEAVPVTGAVERVRAVKDAGELELIRRAMRITDEALAAVLPEVRPGVRERELALRLEWEMKRRGAEGTAFDFIVASGPRSAMPHGVAGDRALERGDFVTFDIGARYQGYCADMTRTVILGEADERQRAIYDLVLRAQEAALAAVRAGVRASEVDAAARRVIADAGYGEAFGHGLGHGVGLDVHEAPSLNARSEDVLEEGMVVTIEPGVYLEGWGGVRIEDSVVVTAAGYELLTFTAKDLMIL